MGDGNNITHSWIRLAARFDFELVCACPEGFEPDAATVELANSSGAGKVVISHDVYDVSASPTPPYNHCSYHEARFRRAGSLRVVGSLQVSLSHAGWVCRL